MRKEILNDALTIKLVTASGHNDLAVDIEQEAEPGPEVVFHARIDFAKATVFRLVQEM